MASRDPSRPNILLFLTDDQGAWALGCAGNAELRTPNLDALAASGIRYDRWFCVSPVCSPARASILTGNVPSRHGVHDWLSAGNSTVEPARDGRLIRYLDGQTAYTDVLAARGYVCGLSGKWHLGDAHHPQHGFSFWCAHARGGGDYYQAPMVRDETRVEYEPRYVTDAIADRAIDFLDAQRSAAAPFYLSVHFTAPHSPWERHQHPPEIYDAYFKDCPFASVPDEPRHPGSAAAAMTDFFDSPLRRRQKLSGYFAAVTAMDAAVGRVLERLDRLSLRENSLVLFLGDNGMNMGHHGICGKGNGTWPLNMYDTSVLVPAIVSRPGHVPAGVVSAAFRSHLDVFPTLLDYAGLPDPGRAARPGLSFAADLRGGAAPGHEAVVAFNEYGPVRMIRTAEWKYVGRHPDGPHELFDLRGDPGERTNRIDDPACATTAVDLRRRMEEWFGRYAEPALDGRLLPVKGKGQTGLATEPVNGDVPFAQSAGAWLRRTLRRPAWPAGIPESPLFRVTVNGEPVTVYDAPAGAFAAFVIDGRADISIELGRDVAGPVVVRPLKRGAVPAIEGRRLSFFLAEPRPVMVEIEGHAPLYIFADPPDADAPAPDAPGVRFFEAGRVHEVGEIALRDGETVYIESGAVVRGAVGATGARGIAVRGRGLLDGSVFRRGGPHSRHAIRFERCSEFLIEGITIIEPSRWTVLLGGCRDGVVRNVKELTHGHGSDGIDLVSCRRLRVEGCFLRNGDDGVVVKAMPDRVGGGDGRVDDIVVSDCSVVTFGAGSALEIGHELRTDSVRGVTFRDCSIMGVHSHGAALSIHNADRALVEDIVYENIDVEHHFTNLVDFRVLRSRWSRDAERGRIRGVRLRDVRVRASVYNPGYSVSLIGGTDAAHGVEDVTFENVTIGGRKATDADALDLYSRHARGIVFR